MQAMQDYKLKSGRMFPTWSEVLEVLRALGYEKLPTAAPPALSVTSPAPKARPTAVPGIMTRMFRSWPSAAASKTAASLGL